MDKSNDRIPKIEWRIAKKLADRARANAKFAALPDDKKRVAIAKDVLRWLAAGKLMARAGRYLVAPPQVEDHINGYRCDACALGSLFACAVEHGEAGGTIRRYETNRHEGVPPVAFALNDSHTVASTIDGKELYSKLGGIFPLEQLIAIEAAFEGSFGLPSPTYTLAGATHDGSKWTNIPAYLEDAITWNRHNASASAKTRMKRIMQNIIRHHGTFVPTTE